MTNFDRRKPASPAEGDCRDLRSESVPMGLSGDFLDSTQDTEDDEVIILNPPTPEELSARQAELEARRQDYNHRIQFALLDVLQKRQLVRNDVLINAIDRLFIADKNTEMEIAGGDAFVSISVPFDEMFEQVLTEALVVDFERFLDENFSSTK